MSQLDVDKLTAIIKLFEPAFRNLRNLANDKARDRTSDNPYIINSPHYDNWLNNEADLIYSDLCDEFTEKIGRLVDELAEEAK